MGVTPYGPQSQSKVVSTDPIREVSVLIVETDLERLADSMLRYFNNSVIHEHLKIFSESVAPGGMDP